MTTQQAVDLLTPYCQHVLIKNKDEMMTAIHNYLSSKGFFGTLLGGVTTIFANNFFWTFVLTTVLPFVIKVALFVVIALFAPYLTVIESFLDSLIDLLDQSLLSADKKALAKEIITLFRLDPTTLPVDTNVSSHEMSNLMLMRDDLENYADSTNNNLFVK